VRTQDRKKLLPLCGSLLLFGHNPEKLQPVIPAFTHWLAFLVLLTPRFWSGLSYLLNISSSLFRRRKLACEIMAKLWGLVGWKGISNFAWSDGMSERNRAKVLPMTLVLPDLEGKEAMRQNNLLNLRVQQIFFPLLILKVQGSAPIESWDFILIEPK